MADIELLITQLEGDLAEQERHLRAAAPDLLLARLESTQGRLGQLAAALKAGVSLSLGQRVRVETLRQQAQRLQEEAEGVIADLRLQLQASARDRQTLNSYRSAQRWAEDQAAFLNQKG